MTDREAELLALMPPVGAHIRMGQDSTLFRGHTGTVIESGSVFSLVEFADRSRLWCGNDTFLRACIETLFEVMD